MSPEKSEEGATHARRSRSLLFVLNARGKGQYGGGRPG